MKGRGFFALLIAAVLCLNLVSAYYFPSVRQGSQELVFTITDLFEPLLMAFFGPWSSAYLFETLMIFMVILSMVYLALGKIDFIKEQKSIRGILTVVIPLLSIRLFDYEWLITVFNTYKFLGVALSSILPFILFFFFIYNVAGEHGVIRKLGWALFTGIYIGLWSSEYAGEYTSMVYFWTFIAGLVCLAGDNFIARRLRFLEASKKDEYFKAREMARIKTEIHDLQRQITNNALDPKIGRKMIDDLHKHLKWMSKQ